MSGAIPGTALRTFALPDEAAANGAPHGDPGAAFDRCADSLHRYFLVRGGDPHLADDLMQQLWLRTRTLAATGSAEQDEFRLRAVAKNLLCTHWRTEQRRSIAVPLADPALAAELAERLTHEPLPPEWLERREVRDQLRLAITALPSEPQELILEHYFHGRSQAELAAALGTTVRAVEGRLYRARGLLRDALRHLE